MVTSQQYIPSCELCIIIKMPDRLSLNAAQPTVTLVSVTTCRFCLLDSEGCCEVRRCVLCLVIQIKLCVTVVQFQKLSGDQRSAPTHPPSLISCARARVCVCVRMCVRSSGSRCHLAGPFQPGELQHCDPVTPGHAPTRGHAPSCPSHEEEDSPKPSLPAVAV